MPLFDILKRVSLLGSIPVFKRIGSAELEDCGRAGARKLQSASAEYIFLPAQPARPRRIRPGKPSKEPGATASDALGGPLPDGSTG